MDISEFIHTSGKTCSSIPVWVDNGSEKVITTADILVHSIRYEIKSLRFGKQLNQKQQNILRSFLMKNEDAFQWDPKTIGRTKLVEHCIPTADNRPIQQSQYPIPSVARENMNTQVDDILKNNFIIPSTSPWRSPVLQVKKKCEDGTIKYRFCIDLKKVNSITTKDCYSLPRISESVEQFNMSLLYD